MAAKGTKIIRVYEDLGMMLADIHDVTGEQIADLVDPHIRPAIENRHKELRHSIRQIKAARERHAKAKETEERIDLGNPVG